MKKKTLFRNVVIITALAAFAIAFGASAYAATGGALTMADIAAKVTGKSVESVTDLRQESGKTYGEIAQDAGKLDEFKSEALKAKKQILDERVAAGTLTQAQADEIYSNIEQNQAACDGDGGNRGSCGLGAGFGRGGCGQGAGLGNGAGRGRGGVGGCGACGLSN